MRTTKYMSVSDKQYMIQKEREKRERESWVNIERASRMR